MACPYKGVLNNNANKGITTIGYKDEPLKYNRSKKIYTH
jgi:hypothetical protein